MFYRDTITRSWLRLGVADLILPADNPEVVRRQVDGSVDPEPLLSQPSPAIVGTRPYLYRGASRGRPVTDPVHDRCRATGGQNPVSLAQQPSRLLGVEDVEEHYVPDARVSQPSSFGREIPEM